MAARRGQRGTWPYTGRVQDRQDDGLDGDAAEDVADGDIELAGQGGADGDGDLREVGGDRQEYQPAQRAAQVKALGEHVRVVGQLDTRVPDDGRGTVPVGLRAWLVHHTR
ncbi:hypothetical protein FHS34_007706 [Streptomyces echinatus]|uniref:Uncharacterized protein n=1 Tax=Streptomyces echinatus TaxID=67293 RepID=A0A7W9Q3V1_9ACTN|nr:hypothetical protein [Streptomyces echinatus]MBB5932197.1 hypothetical protein [Streptomyces echinatus]